MSWTRASSVPTGGSGPRVLQLDQGGQPGHGSERAGRDGRDLWHDGRRDLWQGDRDLLPDGSDGQDEGRALLPGAHTEGLYGKNWM